MPVPGPNELLIRLSVTSLCGSDLGMALGHMGPVGNILGHEGAGRIAAIGSDVPSLDWTQQSKLVRELESPGPATSAAFAATACT